MRHLGFYRACVRLNSYRLPPSASLIRALILVLVLAQWDFGANARPSPSPAPAAIRAALPPPPHVRVPSKRVEHVLQEFQTQHENSSSLVLVTRSNRYILIQGVYEVESLANKFSYHEDDPLVGCYAFGLWLFYSDPNYNWDSDDESMIPDSRVEWILSTNRTIFYPFSMNVKSFRTPSGSTPITEPTFTVFLGHNFTGPSDIETDSNYANPPYSKPKSLIVTGHNPWYVYTAGNFVQKTVCLVPINNHLMIGNFHSYCATRLLRHINSAHIDGCTVVLLDPDPTNGPNACSKNGRQARITHVRNESGENVIIRRVPPIFMSTDKDENRVNS